MMRFKTLGRSGLRVTELCLGTMTFGTEWGWGADKKESKKIFDAFGNAGGNFIDTANYYTGGSSEKFVGDFISSDRHHWVLASKYTLWDRKEDPNFSGNHRKNMIRSVEDSLQRLGTDYMDVLYLHAWDGLTPAEEVLRAFDDLITSGKVLYAGISDTPAWEVSRMNTIADMRGWHRFNALQVEYSMLQRSTEADLIPMAEKMEMAVLAWSPLAGGALTGKYLEGNDDGKRLAADNRRLDRESTSVVKRLVKVAGQIGCTPAQLAIKWTMMNHRNVIPIVGARTEKQIKDSLKCLEVQVNDRQLTSLNKASEIKLGFPHDFLASEGVQNVIFGDQVGRIDS